MAVVGNLEITGIELGILADTNGTWSLIDSSGTIIGRSETLDKAKAQARVALAKRKVKVSVPFITANGERGVATGIHAGDRSILARLDNSGAVRLDGYTERRVLRPDIPEERLSRWLEIRDSLNSLEREKANMEREWIFDIGQAVQRAIEKAAEEEAA